MDTRLHYFVLKATYCVMHSLTSKVAWSGLYLYCVVHSIILQNMLCNLFLVFLFLKSHKINIHTHITYVHRAVHICFVIHSVAVIKYQSGHSGAIHLFVGGFCMSY